MGASSTHLFIIFNFFNFFRPNFTFCPYIYTMRIKSVFLLNSIVKLCSEIINCLMISYCNEGEVCYNNHVEPETLNCWSARAVMGAFSTHLFLSRCSEKKICYNNNVEPETLNCWSACALNGGRLVPILFVSRCSTEKICYNYSVEPETLNCWSARALNGGHLVPILFCGFSKGILWQTH